jgi:hypothetical protein
MPDPKPLMNQFSQIGICNTMFMRKIWKSDTSLTPEVASKLWVFVRLDE